MNPSSCPIVNPSATPPSSCPITGCLHRAGRSCAVSTSHEGNVQSVSVAFQTDAASISDSVSDIQAAIVADHWHLHITGTPLVDGSAHSIRHASSQDVFPQFVEWNRSQFSWQDVCSSLEQILNSTSPVHPVTS